MQGSDEEHRSGKTTKGALRETRLALKLRQNLVRRKEKTRAAVRSAERATGPVLAASVLPEDKDQGD